MLKRILYLLFLLFLVGFVSAGTEIDMELTETNYGVGQNFVGFFNISSDDLFDGDSVFEASVESCGSYSDVSADIYDILQNASLTSESKYTYERTGSSDAIILNFNHDSDLFGFYLANEIVSEIEFFIFGGGGPFKLDIGDDGEIDWQYVGGFSGWSLGYFPDEESSSYTLGSAVEFNPGQVNAIESITIPHNGLSSELKIKVNAVAKTVGETGGILKARIGNKECEFSNIGQSWTDISCELDVGVLSNPAEMVVRISSDSDDFRIPRYPGSNYYFVYLENGIYSEDLTNVPTKVNDTLLVNMINQYRNENCEYGEWCTVPVRAYMDDVGYSSITSLKLVYGASETNNFWSLEETINTFNLTGLSIPLNALSALTVPDSVGDTCLLTVEFDNEDTGVVFNITERPESIIEASSLYSSVGMDINFDGTSSSSGDASVVSYTWDFGDSSSTVHGGIVSHKYMAEGDYTVRLTVTGAGGYNDSSSIVVHVVSLEDHLDVGLPESISAVDVADSYFSGLSGELNDTFYLLGYGNILNESKIRLEELLVNFTTIKNSASSETIKNQLYGPIATEFHEIKQRTPSRLLIIDRLSIDNVGLLTFSDVFDYGGITGVTGSEMNYYLQAVYDFNQNNVEVDMDSKIINVDFLEGSNDYGLIEKKINVSSSSSNILVEDLRNYVIDNIVAISPGANVADSVISWNMLGNTFNAVYLVEGLTILERINSIVYSDVIYNVPEIIWDQNCASNNCTYKWCGDGKCTEEYEDEISCEADCVQKYPVLIYVLLLLIVAIGIFYFNFYTGPGNFRDASNKLTVSLFNKRLFTNDADMQKLKQYVTSVLKQGYKKEQVRNALIKKGWKSEQVDFAFDKK